MDNFIDEVDEELKRERQLALWSKYGRYALAVVLLGLISVSSFIGWRQYQTNERTKTGLEYMAAGELLALGKTKESLAAFRDISKNGASGFGDLAHFREAALLASMGNTSAAAKVYDGISKNSAIDEMLRDLALVLYALNMADNAAPQALIARIKPLTLKTSPWRFSALEITAMLLGKRGDQKGAKEIYKRLADDPATPPRLRARAAESLAIIGG